MTSRDLNQIFEEFAPTGEQEQVMLNRLLTEQKEVRPVNRIKKMTVVLVAAALMLMACAFTVVTGLDQRILTYFGGGEEQAQLVSGGVIEVEKSFQYENGWTIHIQQVLADRYSLAVLAEVVAPEGTVLDGENYYFELGMEVASQMQGQEGVGSWGYGPVILEQGDGQDNRLTFLCTRGSQQAEGQSLNGQSLTLTPMWLQESGGSKLRVDFSEEEQSCTVQLPEKDSGRTYEVNAPIQVGEEEMTLGELYLSPISVAFSLQGEGNDSRMWGPTEMSYMEEGAVLHMADGKAVAVRRVVSQTYDQNTGAAYCVFQTEEIVKPEDVVSVTLLGQTFSLDGLTPVEG